MINGLVQLDLQKGFETVLHSFLLYKLKHYGFSPRTLSWFENYLTSRTQVVRCKGEVSNPEYVTIGVPQGTVLGPVLFLLYVNDLPFYLNSDSSQMYADDTSLKAFGETKAQVKK